MMNLGAISLLSEALRDRFWLVAEDAIAGTFLLQALLLMISMTSNNHQNQPIARENPLK